jgi:hypothetical protein
MSGPVYTPPPTPPKIIKRKKENKKYGKEISRDQWKMLNNSVFSAFEHTPCLTKNLPFCLEYFYFILICTRR